MAKLAKYSMIGLTGRFFRLSGRVFDCWRLVAVYAVPLTILSLMARFLTTACLGGVDAGFCRLLNQKIIFIPMFVMYIAAYAHLLLALAVDFYDIAFNSKPFGWNIIWHQRRDKWQKEGFLLAYIISYALLFLLAINLLLWPANPNWRIEMVYFVIIFGCFMLLLLLIRLMPSVSRYLAQKHADFADIYSKTKDRSYVAIITFLVLLGFILLCHMRLDIWFAQLALQLPWLTAIFCYAKIFLQLTFGLMIFVLCRAQDELLAAEK